MPNKKEYQRLIDKCIGDKGWSAEHCKRYIGGSVYKDKFAELNNIPIFMSGNWKGIEFTAKDLQQIVDNTNELIKNSEHAPPVKLGHNEDQKLKDGLPSFGWIDKLRIIGNKIFADIKDVPDKLMLALKEKKYKKVSAEIYTNYSKVNPNSTIKGKVLRALAILGADVPEVKGLGDILACSDIKETLILEFTEEALQMRKLTVEQVAMLCSICADKMVSNKITAVNEDELLKEFSEDKQELVKSRIDKIFAEPPIVPEPAADKSKQCGEGMEWNESEQKCQPVANELPSKFEDVSPEDISMAHKQYADMPEKEKSKIQNPMEMADGVKPSPEWWDKCISASAGKTQTPEKLCGHLWGKQQEKKKTPITSADPLSNPNDVIQSGKYTEEIETLKKENAELKLKSKKDELQKFTETFKGVFVPALKERFETVMLAQSDAVMKFGEKDVDTFGMLLTLTSDIIKMSENPLVSGEVLKNIESESIDTPEKVEKVIESKILSKEKFIEKYGDNISDYEVYALAMKIEVDEKIPYVKAYNKAITEINKK